MASDALATEQIKDIALEDLVPGPGNRKHGGFDKAQLQELAESIKAVGILQPLVVRPVPADPDGKRGGYEIVAGERRWRAAKLAGKVTVPCVVRDLDERTALMVRTVENIQRQDIHPLDEADGFLALRERGGMEISQIAEQVGRSVPYVYQRLKLCDLVPETRKLLEDGTLPVGHAVLIARLPPKDQEAVTTAYQDETDWRPWKLKDLQAHIDHEILTRLSAAPFKLADASLLPAAGACTACPKRTGAQSHLFPEYSKSDSCLDRTCYRAKTAAFVARKVEQLGPKTILVNGHGAPKKGEVSPWRVTPAKKGDKGAVPVLYVSGPDQGKVSYGKLKPDASSRLNGESPKDKEQRAKEEQERKAEMARNRSLFLQLLEVIPREVLGNGIPEDLMRAMAIGLQEHAQDNVYELATPLEAVNLPEPKIMKTSGSALASVVAQLAFAAFLCPDGYGCDVKLLAAMAKARGIKPVLTACRVCGCTEADCRQCIEKTGEPCHWVEPDLCSACAPKKKRGKKAAA